MATIDIGKLTFTHKGDYAGGTAYVANDVVYYNGSAYIAKTSTTGNLPTSTAHWNNFAAGSGGIWSSGLSIGTAGQVVKVNSGATALEFGDAGGGLDSLHVVNTASANVTANTHTKFTSWETPLKNDFGNAWNSTNGEFTIPTTGSYFLNFWAGSGHHGNHSRYRESEVYVDGSEPSETANGYLSSQTRITANSTQDKGWQQSTGIVTLNANQVLSFYIWMNDEGASNDNHLRGARLSIMKLF